MDEKVAVVTGAGSGIGRAVAVNLVRRGYSVYAVGRSMDTLVETGNVAGLYAGSVTPIQVDVADAKGMSDALKGIDGVQVVVASAGICVQAALEDPDSHEVWEKVMAVNAGGVWNTFHTLSKKLNSNARVVVVSSGLGKLGRSHYGAYTASKHAVLGLVKCFAAELANRGITVNAVCPGWVETEMSRNDLRLSAAQRGIPEEEARKEAVGQIPIGRFIAPREVAGLVEWLTCEKSGAVTGQSYNISGGEFCA